MILERYRKAHFPETVFPEFLVDPETCSRCGRCVEACPTMGLTMGPATESMMGSLPVSRAGIGSAMNDTTRHVGGALGVAVLGTLMNATYIDKVEELKVVAALPEGAVEAVRSSIQGAHIVAEQFPPEISEAIISGSSEAFTIGMTEAMFIGAIIMIVTAFITAMILPKRVRPTPESDVSNG